MCGMYDIVRNKPPKGFDLRNLRKIDVPYWFKAIDTEIIFRDLKKLSVGVEYEILEGKINEEYEPYYVETGDTFKYVSYRDAIKELRKRGWIK